MIRTLKAKLRFSAEPISVSYSGGIFHAGEFILAPLRKKAEELNCILCEPKYSATEGAPHGGHGTVPFITQLNVRRRMMLCF